MPNNDAKVTVLTSNDSALGSLRTPLIAAPMAGGPTAPALVSAAAAAGGMGFLAAGYQSVEALHSDITEVRAAGTELFGVNLFITMYDDARSATSDDEIDEFSRTLAGIAESAGLDGPAPATFTDNDYDGKIEYLCENPVPIVSFTFGAPEADIVRRLHEVGTEVAVMITSIEDARHSRERGADVVIAQGTEAGGHQSTFSIADAPGPHSTLKLLADVATSLPGVPVIATGGIHSADDVRAALSAGATAVQLGTALLNTEEAGTSAAHRSGLVRHFKDIAHSSTEFTLGFSGRPARSVVNDFVEATRDAPSAYPYNNQMTKPLRAAANKKAPEDGAKYVALWCGKTISRRDNAPAGFLEGGDLASVFDQFGADTYNI